MNISKILLTALLFISINASAQDGIAKSYFDSKGNEVVLPQGIKSFADEFVSKIEGSPKSWGECTNALNALGEPDYDSNPNNKVNFFSLGCGGEATFKFQDNGLINQPGPDLYIFEIGPSVEPTNIYVSEDNDNWVYVGETSGGTSSIELDGKVNDYEIYYFIKLVDLRTACGGRGGTDGADIDAIAAIGSTPIGSTQDQSIVLLNKGFVDSINVVTKTINESTWDNPTEIDLDEEPAAPIVSAPKKPSIDKPREDPKEIVTIPEVDNKQIENETQSKSEEIDSINLVSQIIKETEFVDALNVARKEVKITIYDDSTEDGDIIDVILNGKIILTDQKVTKEGKVVELTLNKGVNNFVIKAKNVGIIYPNTASIKISDGTSVYSQTLSSKAGESKGLKITL